MGGEAAEKNEVIANCRRLASFWCKHSDIFLEFSHLLSLSLSLDFFTHDAVFILFLLLDSLTLHVCIAFGSVSLDFNFQFVYINIASGACEHKIFYFSLSLPSFYSIPKNTHTHTHSVLALFLSLSFHHPSQFHAGTRASAYARSYIWFTKACQHNKHWTEGKNKVK